MNSKAQEMINLVREEMERMISRNPKQEKSMETDIQIVRELIPEAYVCLDNAVNVIWPAESMQEVENLLDDFAQMGILLKEYIGCQLKKLNKQPSKMIHFTSILLMKKEKWILPGILFFQQYS